MKGTLPVNIQTETLPDEEYERFLLYPYYRLFHDCERAKYANGQMIELKYSGRNHLPNEPLIKRALEIFSATNARKKWSSLNVDEKVALIATRTTINTGCFLMNTLTVYSDASEVLHGNLYGCGLPSGAYRPRIDVRDLAAVQENLMKNVALLYVQISSMISETIKLLAESDPILEPTAKDSEANIQLQVVALQAIFPKKEP